MLAKRLVMPVSVRDRPWNQGGQAGGDPQQAHDADEFLLVAASDAEHASLVAWLHDACGLLFHPVAVVARAPLSSEQLDGLIDAGADRVYFDALESDRDVRAATQKWGAQAVGVHLRLRVDGSMTGSGPSDGVVTMDTLREFCAAGAGELLIAVDDAELGDCVPALRAIVSQVDVPVIVAGKTRTTEGLRRVLVEAGVCGLVFERDCIEEFETIAELKTYLAAAGIMVRGT